MKYDFDEIIDRRNTRAFKYDYRKEYFGTDDLIPMWVADMDFAAPQAVVDALVERARHEEGERVHALRTDDADDARAGRRVREGDRRGAQGSDSGFCAFRNLLDIVGVDITPANDCRLVINNKRLVVHASVGLTELAEKVKGIDATPGNRIE